MRAILAVLATKADKYRAAHVQIIRRFARVPAYGAFGGSQPSAGESLRWLIHQTDH
jgi:hypothetical protein